MTLRILIIFASIVIAIGCEISESSNENSVEILKEDRIKNGSLSENNFPITIEFGSIGWASQTRKIKVTEDSIFVLIQDEIKSSYSSIDSKLKETLDKYSRIDFEGDKHYSSLTFDGGYMQISNKYGKRKFDNCFGMIYKNIKFDSDTIGLSKYEEIYENSIDLLVNIK